MKVRSGGGSRESTRTGPRGPRARRGWRAGSWPPRPGAQGRQCGDLVSAARAETQTPALDVHEAGGGLVSGGGGAAADGAQEVGAGEGVDGVADLVVEVPDGLQHGLRLLGPYREP